MESRILLFTLTVIFLCIRIEAANIFVASPNTLRIGEQETVSVLLEGNKAETVEVYLQDHPGKTKTFSRTVGRAEPRISTEFKVQVNPEDLPDKDILAATAKHYVSLVAKAGNWFHKETLLLVNPRSGYVFIQTDKPIYTPKQTVHMRIITLNEDLIPQNKMITLQIKNPQDITVEHQNWKVGKVGRRIEFYTYDYSFPPYPLFGEWSAVVSYGYDLLYNTTVKFEVKEYVLPTFSVDVTAPEIILESTKKITGSAHAKYVYGEPVHGTANFKFGVKLNTGDIIIIGTLYNKQLQDGKVDYQIDVNEFMKHGKISGFPDLEGNHLFVEVSVLEQATGQRETGINENGIFTLSPYDVSFKRCLNNFMPGYTTLIPVDINFVSGKPAPGIPAVITVTDEKGRAVVVQKSEDTSDERGRCNFLVNPSKDLKQIKVEVKTNDGRGAQYQRKGQHRMSEQSSEFGGVIAIDRGTTKQDLKVNEEFSASVLTNPAGGISLISYMVISRGKILIHKFLPKVELIGHKIFFVVNTDMSPSFRLVVYAVYKGHLLTDSILYNVEPTCKDSVKFKLETDVIDRPKPGQLVKINIVEATKDTKIGLLAVDEAVYILRNKDRLTREKMFQEMEKHDLGCGPGGGSNVQSVLANAGVAILSSTKLTNYKREDYICAVRIRKKREIMEEIVKKYEKRDKQCCMLGMKHDPDQRSCEERHAIFEKYDFDGKETCMAAFLGCCNEKHLYLLRNIEKEGRGRFGFDPADQLITVGLEEEQELLKQLNVRKDFRETWIFDDVYVGPKGRVEKELSLPHSITTWVVQAVGISNTGGMCIAEPLKITTFKSIFVQLNIPYSVVRNEQVEIQATVFNNHAHQSVRASVYMYGVKGLCSGAEEGQRTERKVLDIGPSLAKSVSFPVVPLKVGEFPVRVVVFTVHGSDFIEKKLNVVPEGAKDSKLISLQLDPTNQQKRQKRSIHEKYYIDSIDPEKKMQISIVELQPPPNYVPDTARCLVSVIADRFGPVVETALENTEKLIQQPRGCGEQTMLFMAPTLYTVKYLKVTGQLNAETEKNGYKFIRDGYSRELTFRKNDGSYAAWQNRPSSTWLTAFVMRVFCQAQKLIEIDEKVICSGMQWLVQRQKPDGSFVDEKPVIHQEMIGGVKGALPMTAFVLMALHECSCTTVPGLKLAKIRAAAYLEIKVPHIQDPYIMSLVAYALSLAGNNAKVEANRKLLTMATFQADKNYHYWGDPNSPRAIETAGYGLLVQILNNDIEYANSIVNWLNSKRTLSGAFKSTQDTVIALYAMSEFSILAKKPETDLQCNVTLNNDPSFFKELHFKESTANILQQFQISNLGGHLIFNTTGYGMGQLAVELKYNVPVPPEKLCKFDIDVKVNEVKEEIQQVINPRMPGNDVFDLLPDALLRNLGFPKRKERSLSDNIQDYARVKRDDRGRVGDGGKRGNDGKSKLLLEIQICVKYLSHVDSNMAIIEAGIFTGFKVLIDELKQLVKVKNSKIARFEASDKSVVFYMDSAPHDKPYCFKFRIVRQFIVGNIQSSVVKVYDYYKPNESCSQFYSPDNQSPLIRTICEGSVCQCAEGGCPPRHPFEGITQVHDISESRKLLLDRACVDHDYVWKGTVESKRKENGFRYISFRVTSVFKEGIEQKQNILHTTKVLMVRDSCSVADLDIQQEYVIMGRDGAQFKDEDTGILLYRYILDQTTSIFKWTRISVAENKQLTKAFRWLEKHMVMGGGGCPQ
ncbi:LOW QUALITY PROTEIN: venom factor-like [Tachypleus tridentatus]|uniref:LOW QUALITY PROTEIN: venom factor-like n=1 Tax=Tachypleus tridentatus TaxID=6853 RepID=UPI003FD528E5